MRRNWSQNQWFKSQTESFRIYPRRKNISHQSNEDSSFPKWTKFHHREGKGKKQWIWNDSASIITEREKNGDQFTTKDSWIEDKFNKQPCSWEIKTGEACDWVRFNSALLFSAFKPAKGAHLYLLRLCAPERNTIQTAGNGLLWFSLSAVPMKSISFLFPLTTHSYLIVLLIIMKLLNTIAYYIKHNHQPFFKASHRHHKNNETSQVSHKHQGNKLSNQSSIPKP